MAATRPAIHVAHKSYSPTSWHELCQLLWQEFRDNSYGHEWLAPGGHVVFTFKDCSFDLPAEWFLTPAPELNFTMLRVLYDDDLIVQSLLDILEHK